MVEIFDPQNLWEKIISWSQEHEATGSLSLDVNCFDDVQSVYKCQMSKKIYIYINALLYNTN